jgi:hypothetical protein
MLTDQVLTQREKLQKTLDSLLTRDEFYEKVGQVLAELKAIREIIKRSNDRLLAKRSASLEDANAPGHAVVQ